MATIAQASKNQPEHNFLKAQTQKNKEGKLEGRRAAKNLNSNCNATGNRTTIRKVVTVAVVIFAALATLSFVGLGVVINPLFLCAGALIAIPIALAIISKPGGRIRNLMPMRNTPFVISPFEISRRKTHRVRTFPIRRKAPRPTNMGIFQARRQERPSAPRTAGGRRSR